MPTISPRESGESVVAKRKEGGEGDRINDGERDGKKREGGRRRGGRWEGDGEKGEGGRGREEVKSKCGDGEGRSAMTLCVYVREWFDGC